MTRLRMFPVALACALFVVFVGLSAAQAASPPALAPSEVLSAQCSAFPSSGFGTCFSPGLGSVTMTCTLQGNGAVLSFTASGVAVGPYPGTFTESGSYTLGPPVSFGGTVAESVIGFSATFSIQSPAGTVTGTKTGTAAQQLPPGSFGFCTAFGSPQFTNGAAAFGSYTATITTAQGSFRDTGGTLAQVNQPPPLPPSFVSGPSGFFETFSSSNGVVPLCDENSQGNQGQNGNNQGCVNP